MVGLARVASSSTYNNRSYRQNGVAEVAVHVAHLLCRRDRLGRHSYQLLRRLASPRLAVGRTKNSLLPAATRRKKKRQG
jgi:hypothetical protein